MSLRNSAGQLDLHSLFLVDETKRILRGRFSREFQDNLFALLYGSPLKGLCQIVFAGTQELYLFSEAAHLLLEVVPKSISWLVCRRCLSVLCLLKIPPENYR